MKKVYTLILLLSVVSVFSQIRFKQGYFIKDNGEKVTCLIKNMDWKNNPTSFKYKVDENGDVKEESVKNIQEFSVSNESKFIKSKVQIDKSTEIVNDMERDSLFHFEEETLFLKQLIKGKANLFSYEKGNMIKFFYNVEGMPIEQLRFKMYLNSTGNAQFITEYKQQIWNNLKCKTITFELLKDAEYSKNSLQQIFHKYNECMGVNSEVVERVDNSKKLHLYATLGLSQTSFSIYDMFHDLHYDFKNKTGFRLGLEVEKVLPFNRNKWALFFEPNYQSYPNTLEAYNRTNTIDYKTIGLPFGFRYYMFLSDKSKIYLDVSYEMIVSLNSQLNLNYPIKLDSSSDLNFGLGYSYNNKFRIGLKHRSAGEILTKNPSLESNLKSFYLVFGYQIF